MRSFLTSVSVVALAFPLTAQSVVVNRKLSGPMVSGIVGDVGEVLISPSGDRALYEVFLRTDVFATGEVARLKVCASDGSGGSTTLTPYYPDIVSLRWTPDGTRAVFVNRASDGVELYSVPVDGSLPPWLLDQDLVPGSSFDDEVRLTDDGSRVVYLRQVPAPGWPADDTVDSLYSVPTDLSAAPSRLSASPQQGHTVSSFLVTGSTVVYRASQFGLWGLYAVPADGSSGSIELTSSVVLTDEFAIDSSGTRVLYLVGSVYPALYSAPLDGSAAPVQLVSSHVESFRVSPAGSEVAFRKFQGLDPWQLFLVPVDGSAAPVHLIDGPPGHGTAHLCEFSPDGTRIVFEIETSGAWGSEGLYSARVSDGSIATLDTTAVSSLQFSPDSARVVFQPKGQRDLYSAPIGGGSPAVQINPAFDSFVAVAEYAVTPDSLRVLYRADAETDGLVELFLISIDRSGAPAVRLNPPMEPGGSVDLFRMAPDSSFVLYRLDAENDGVDELVRSPGHAVLNAPLPTGPIGDALFFTARNGRVVYVADQDVDGQLELYGAPSDGSAPPVELSGTLVSGGDLASDFGLTADGSIVVYRADAEVNGLYELYSAPSDGSAAPVKLSEPLAAGGRVWTFRLSPDGARVAYIADQAALPGTWMYSVPIGGGMSVPLGPASTDTVFAITPDSTRVVAESSNRLYSIAIDGSGAPIDLSGPVTAIGEFEVTPDSARVVYRPVLAGVPRLFSVSVLGGTRVDLSGTLVSGGHVNAFALGMNGERVVYRADRFVNGQLLIFSVPTDGSSASLVLNGPLVAGGNVTHFRISPDGETVVYEADQEVNQSYRLHRVPVDGSAPDVLISTQNFESHSFEIAPDGEHAVVRFSGLQSVPIAGGSVVQISPTALDRFAFTADGRYVVQFRSGMGRLVLTPITADSPVPLSPVLAGGYAEFVMDGERVIYRAAQNQDYVFEVYSSWLADGVTQHAPPTETHWVTR